MMINGGVFQLSVIMVIMWLSLCMPKILGYIYHYAKNGVSLQKCLLWWATPFEQYIAWHLVPLGKV